MIGVGHMRKIPHKFVSSRHSDRAMDFMDPYSLQNTVGVMFKLRSYSFYDYIQFSSDETPRFPLLRELVKLKHQMIEDIDMATDEQLALKADQAYW